MEPIRNIFTFLTVFFFCLCASVAEISAATINAKSASYADVSEAISSAVPEDTVLVPAGSVTWNSELTITKGVNLIGPGSGNVTIKSNGVTLIRYDPTDYTANNAFRLSGFTFDANGVRALVLGSGKIAPFTRQTNVRIDHNRFINTGAEAGGAAIFNYGSLYGVVDNNTFDTGFYPIRHSSGTAIDNWWDNSPQNIFNLGDSNFMFWEDNTITISQITETNGSISNGQYSLRYVFRYNTIILEIPVYAAFDLHGEQPGGGMGACFGAELYGNQITTNNHSLQFQKTRAGQSMVFMNNATKSTAPSNVAYIGTTSDPCPVNHTALKVIHDTYWFNNRINNTGVYWNDSASADLTCNGLSNIPLLGRDVFSNTTTPGVTAGPLGSIPGTCTVGQGYWATDQSTSNLSGMVGVNPTTPISGTFYKCTSTNTWTAYYTPYTYPHPLRVEDSEGKDAPASPTELKINP